MKDGTKEELFEKYCQDKQHAREVERIALLLFEEVNNKITEFSDKEKEILKTASLLHDIGYSVKSKSHHKYSQKIILDEGLSEFTLKESMIISCICRYHRGGLPDKKDHEVYCSLDKKERKLVKQLGGILKIADGLEKIQNGQITGITLKYDEENSIVETIIHLKSNDYRPTLDKVIRKKDLFEIGFKTQIVFKFD